MADELKPLGNKTFVIFAQKYKPGDIINYNTHVLICKDAPEINKTSCPYLKEGKLQTCESTEKLELPLHGELYYHCCSYSVSLSSDERIIQNFVLILQQVANNTKIYARVNAKNIERIENYTGTKFFRVFTKNNTSYLIKHTGDNVETRASYGTKNLNLDIPTVIEFIMTRNGYL